MEMPEVRSQKSGARSQKPEARRKRRHRAARGGNEGIWEYKKIGFDVVSTFRMSTSKNWLWLYLAFKAPLSMAVYPGLGGIGGSDRK